MKSILLLEFKRLLIFGLCDSFYSQSVLKKFIYDFFSAYQIMNIYIYTKYIYHKIKQLVRTGYHEVISFLFCFFDGLVKVNKSKIVKNHKV